MKIKTFTTPDEQIKDLENRSLIFPDDLSRTKLKTYLIHYGYFSFIRKLSNNLMFSDVEKQIYRPEFDANNLRYLFDIDRNISVIIFKFFRSIEFLFNSSVFKVFTKKLNKITKTVYLASIKSEELDLLFPNLDNNIGKQKKWNKDNVANLFEDLYKNFNAVDFNAKEEAKLNYKNESEDVIKKINDGWFCQTINSKRNIIRPNGWQYLDAFSLFQTISFSQLIRIFNHFSTSMRNEVIMDFFRNVSQKEKHIKIKEGEFKVLLSVLSVLRNTLMHNGTMIKFSHEIRNEHIKIFNKYFGLNIKNNTLKLNEVIQIFETIINIDQRMFSEINAMVKTKMDKAKNNNIFFSELLFEIIENEANIKIIIKDLE